MGPIMTLVELHNLFFLIFEETFWLVLFFLIRTLWRPLLKYD